MSNFLRLRAREEKTRAPIFGNRYPKGTKLIRKKDGVEFVVQVDQGQGLRFVGHPEKIFDRSYFTPKT